MRCPSCFASAWDQFFCSSCGYQPVERRDGIYLPIGSELHNGEYSIGKVLGRPGGFGITYLAWDTRLDLKVAIKEYLPLHVAARAGDGKTVTIHTVEYAEGFNFGLEKFLDEAKVLAHFRHPNIVRVMNFFRENGTAYMVMDYLEGESLAEYLMKVGRITGPDAAALFAPVLDGVAHIHARDFIHRDIKPSNIYLTHEGQLILLDFGSARQALREKSQSMTTILSPGFAPWEQYHRKGKQGPWTDVYACAATLYAMVTGQAPSDGAERAIDDDMEPVENVVPGIDQSLATAINQGLAINPELRPQTAGAFQAILLGREIGGLQSANDSRSSVGIDVAHAITEPIEKKLVIEGTTDDMPQNHRMIVASHPLNNQSPFIIKAPVDGYIASVLPVDSLVNKGKVVCVMNQLRTGETVAVTVDCDGRIEKLDYKIGDYVQKDSGVLVLRPTTNKSVTSDDGVHGASQELSSSGKQGNIPRKWFFYAAVLLIGVGLSVYLNGTMTWKSADGTYSGQVKWGTRHGMGTLVSADGTRYTSNWIDGYAEGPGELVLPDGRKLTGTFDMAKKEATVQLADGSRYSGGFERNRFNGRGLLKRPSGAEYEGEFVDGKKEGVGVIKMPDGTKYDGRFRNDELHGNTEIRTSDGEIIKGEYFDGKKEGVFKRFPPNNSDDAGLMFVSNWRNGSQIGTEKVKSTLNVDVKINNQTYHGNVINETNTRFPKSQIRFICYSGMVSNESPHSISGQLIVKYIRPDGSIKRNFNTSPSGATTKVDMRSNGYISGGWGNDDVSTYEYGRHYIQFFWKGIRVGETYFDVY